MSIGLTSNTTLGEPRAAAGRYTVLQVLPALGAGGVPRGAIDIAAAVSAAGWRSLVASSGGPLQHDIRRAGAEHIVLPLASKNPFTMRANIARLAALIEARDVDVVHARSRGPAWSAYFAARRTGIRFVTTFHGTYRQGGLLKRRYNSVMARGERVIAISHFIADHVCQVYGAAPERVRVIHRGVDTRLYDPENVSADRMITLANRWRLSDGAPVVMLPGRLTRWKGQTVLLEALEKLGRSDLRCLLVGSDQGRRGYRRELDALVRRRNLESVVHIVDDCTDMAAAYMLCDVIVSASTDPEAFGRIIAEAGAMGRPVIASDHGGAREIVVPDETGWLVPPGEPAALAAALETAMALEPGRRLALAKRARARVLDQGFTRDAMCAATMAVYQGMLGDSAATADAAQPGI